jgi:hypothetical protein
MRKIVIPFALAVVLLLTTFVVLQIAHGQTLAEQNSEVVINSESQDGNIRQITAPEGTVPETGGSNQPQIGFIDSPTVACVQPDTTKDECFINWYYMSVNSDPNNIITMTVQLNDFGFVARYNGFFQTSMYVPYNMNPQGYRVACGTPGSGGDPYWGKAYGWTIRARDSVGSASANYGTAYCPAYTP